LHHPEILPVCEACLYADADDFSSSKGKTFLFGELFAKIKKMLSRWQESLFLQESSLHKFFAIG
jgi:hypothetical protein